MFGFVLPYLSDEIRHLGMIASPINFLSALFFAFIGLGVACKANLTDAEDHNVPANHPRYIHDKQKMTLWGVSAAGVVGGIGAKTYKAAKEIGNVDGWKKKK